MFKKGSFELNSPVYPVAMKVGVCVLACVRACVRVCVRACVRALRACMRVSVECYFVLARCITQGFLLLYLCPVDLVGISTRLLLVFLVLPIYH